MARSAVFPIFGHSELVREAGRADGKELLDDLHRSDVEPVRSFAGQYVISGSAAVTPRCRPYQPM